MKPQKPEPKSLQIVSRLLLPVYEEDAFLEFRSPEEILELMAEIEAKPTKFSPEKIKQAIEYGRHDFKDVAAEVHWKEQFIAWQRDRFSDVYCLQIWKNAYDRDVIAGAKIEFQGIRLHDDSIVDKQGIEALLKRKEEFNFDNRPAPCDIWYKQLVAKGENRKEDDANYKKYVSEKNKQTEVLVTVPAGKNVIIPPYVFDEYFMHLRAGEDPAMLKDGGLTIGRLSNLVPLSSFAGLALLRNKATKVEIADLGKNHELYVVPKFEKQRHKGYKCSISMAHPESDGRYARKFSNLGPADMTLNFKKVKK